MTSHNDGRVIATKVNTAALNRLAFHHSIAIENAQSTSDQFSPLNPQPGVLAVAVSQTLFANDAVSTVVSITAAQLKTQLEQPGDFLGEHNYGLFRSARQSMSPVEEFIHLYHILLDAVQRFTQTEVIQFIEGQEPCVGKSPYQHTAHRQNGDGLYAAAKRIRARNAQVRPSTRRSPRWPPILVGSWPSRSRPLSNIP